HQRFTRNMPCQILPSNVGNNRGAAKAISANNTTDHSKYRLPTNPPQNASSLLTHSQIRAAVGIETKSENSAAIRREPTVSCCVRDPDSEHPCVTSYRPGPKRTWVKWLFSTSAVIASTSVSTTHSSSPPMSISRHSSRCSL